MKLNKILIPTISLIGLTSVIPTVACTKSGETDPFPFEFITDISNITILENYESNFYTPSTQSTTFEYPKFDINFGYKGGKKFKDTDNVIIFIDANEDFDAEIQSGDFDLRYGGILVDDVSHQSDGTIQFSASPTVEHTSYDIEVPDVNDHTTWSFSFRMKIRVNGKDYRTENAGKISGFIIHKEV